MNRIRTWTNGAATVALIALAVNSGCSNEPKYDTNLLKNSSFEKTGREGIPKDWKLTLFRGGPNDPVVQYGIDKLAHEGKQSFFFKGDPGTRRFYFLEQEVKVVGADHARVRGWIQGDDVRTQPDQISGCGLLLTYYDKDHHRFQAERIADRRTPVRPGTYPWQEQNFTFPVPPGTHYIAVSCLLSTNGTAWFDDISLEIPKPVHWEAATTKNYVFHWLPGHPFPQGAVEQQQKRFDDVCHVLDVTSNVVINYYYYPDSTTIQRMNGISGAEYANWEDHEFHTLVPADEHEVIHFITDAIGRPPRVIAEGTALWVGSQRHLFDLDGALRMLARGKKVTPFTDLFDWNKFARTDGNISYPTAAGFVKYFVERWGTKQLMELFSAINGMNTYQTVASGFESVTDEDLGKAENDYHIWLIERYGRQ